ncbi:hypothetical protein DICPUDRAFT_38530 [Dictyostelium purpureum]|uniref:T-cell immunomodulatory protein TIP C2 domain-containing protein n=1 Tax=Dictyostelium purpureum TaxID=5786 RepID=F0ZUQ5_DICPU|nr:uncharacterized protein DICPUDRAFT_38530 [Dictyostelium purpureum]EGC32339.1 hypothetical protein DICPUDRAFT_38530 [Dictyostelium purpureum]|eukprot:XP_003291141.1 hypothetical protein DICPUDRAFT_38530 [Dictyostelium purpureum]
MKQFIIGILVFIIINSINIVKCDFFSDFWKPVFSNAPRFSSSQLYSINDIGFSGYSGSVMAFGDFNADKYLDTFFLYSNKSTIQVFLWNVEEWKYVPSNIILNLNATDQIVNIVPGDFTYDGSLDLLVQFTQQNNGDSGQTMYLFIGDYTSISSKGVPIASGLDSPSDQVLVMDANGDLHLDMFGVKDGQRTLWMNYEDTYYEMPAPMANENSLPVSTPHSNSFVDLNGDCLADLFITTADKDGNIFGEVWINNKVDGYSLEVTLQFPPGTGQITFGDFDNDGDIDLVYPVRFTNESVSVNQIFIVFNSQKPVFIIKEDQFNGSLLYSNIENGIPLIIHSGDYNIDGFPDILISLVDQDETTPHIELWQNIPCTSDLCDMGQKGRTFGRVTDGTDALRSIPNAYSAVFVDLGENGIADILVWSGTPNNQSMQAIFNNFYNDAFFFKTLGLNGVCATMCPTGKKFPDPKPYGVNFPGGTFKFTYQDLSGRTHIQIGAQLYSSSYMSLQTPYNLFGLGRTSNYVDQLFYGMPLNQSVHYNNWVGTIPNSQVVAIPYKPSTPTSWTLELFINPSGIFFWVLIAFFAALILLSGICFFLYKREKLQDIKIKNENSQFYFNAL